MSVLIFSWATGAASPLVLTSMMDKERVFDQKRSKEEGKDRKDSKTVGRRRQNSNLQPDLGGEGFGHKQSPTLAYRNHWERLDDSRATATPHIAPE